MVEISLYLAYAALAGLFGALSGVFGKVTVIPEWEVAVYFRVATFLGNGFCTAQMWRYYLKSLQTGSTPICSIVNTGTNFAASALMGMLLFGEEVNAMWAVGALATTVGLAIIVSQEQSSLPETKKE